MIEVSAKSHSRHSRQVVYTTPVFTAANSAAQVHVQVFLPAPQGPETQWHRILLNIPVSFLETSNIECSVGPHGFSIRRRLRHVSSTPALAFLSTRPREDSLRRQRGNYFCALKSFPGRFDIFVESAVGRCLQRMVHVILWGLKSPK